MGPTGGGLSDGWEYIAAQGVERVPVPGNHESLLKEPNVAVLAEKLKSDVLREHQRWLERAAVNGHAMADRARTRLIVLDTSPYSSKLCDTVAFAEPAAGGDAQN